MLTIEQLREIRERMTWGDQQYGQREAGDDAGAMVTYAMHRSARRLGLAAPDSTLEDFLDMVTMNDLTAALEEPRNPTSADSQT